MKTLVALILMMSSISVLAAPNGYFDLKPGITLVSGETWEEGGKTYRLYGVQSCLRGTFYSPNGRSKLDCGDSAIAVLAAYIKDTAPVCAPVAQSVDVTYVSCFATVGADRLDLGTMLISTGWAFAALNQNGEPYQLQYLVTEQEAKDRKMGLWQYPDVQHPAIIVSSQAQKDTAP